MKKFTPERVQVETATALAVVESNRYERYSAYVGLDVHKDTIAVAVAYPGRGAPAYRGEMAHTGKAVAKRVRRLSEELGGGLLLFCYEAGPCGYGLYRQLLALGQECEGVTPPKSARIKTDRRDALQLARLLRAGELRRVWVPDEAQEAMRDLTRCRGDLKAQEHKARQQLNAFVLRHGFHWPRGKSRWTRAPYHWLESLVLPHPWQQVVLQEYIEAVRAASRRVAEMRVQIEQALP